MYLLMTGYQPPGHSIPSHDELEWAFESRTRRKPGMPLPHPTQPPSSPTLRCTFEQKQTWGAGSKEGQAPGCCKRGSRLTTEWTPCSSSLPCSLAARASPGGIPSRPLTSKEGRTAGYLLPMHRGHSLATSLPVVPTRPCEVGLSPPLYRSGNKGSRKRLCGKWHSESVGVNLNTQDFSLQASCCLRKARSQQ